MYLDNDSSIGTGMVLMSFEITLLNSNALILISFGSYVHCKYNANGTIYQTSTAALSIPHSNTALVCKQIKKLISLHQGI